MKYLIIMASLLVLGCSTTSTKDVQVDVVSEFKGMQVTGVSVSKSGRVFVNFPRWRKDIPMSVAEIIDGVPVPYPSKMENSWKYGQKAPRKKFISVQSVYAKDGKLYVLDTSNPFFKGVMVNPRIFVYSLETNKLISKIRVPKSVLKSNSYTNDIRIHSEKQLAFITDSEAPGIIIWDMKTNKFKRVLDNHKYTRADRESLKFGDFIFKNKVHSDGIALDEKKNILWIHALTSEYLYGIDLEELNKKNPQARFSISTAAPDGLILDDNGNLYFADLENDKIQYLKSDRKTIKTLVEGKAVKWADTFSIHNGYLYYTNSRINEVLAGGNFDEMTFGVYKVKL